jgi:DNA-binding PadR family transcriptional regulator
LSIKHAILGLLTGGPLHGYGLKSAYEEHLVPGATLNIGQVYPALDKLQTDGQVTVEVVAQSERPDRKVYTITDAGRKELQEWLAAPSRQEVDPRNETYLKLMLAWRLSRQSPGSADPFAILDSERRACLSRLSEFGAARAKAEKDGEGLPALLLLDLTIRRLNAFQEWLEHCEEAFRRGDQS